MPAEIAHVLVVDDDREHGAFLEEAFSSDQCKVTSYRDPRLALNKFRRQKYQVGILDLKMPGMSGVDLFRRLREEDPEIGLIILTGYPSVDSVLATLKTGAYDYLKKPYRIDDLKKIVYRLLEDKGYLLDLEGAVNKRIGQRIREYRLKSGLTVAQLADQSHFSKSLISQIENAKNSASLSSLSKIARCLKVRLGDLVQDL